MMKQDGILTSMLRANIRQSNSFYSSTISSFCNF